MNWRSISKISCAVGSAGEWFDMRGIGVACRFLKEFVF